MGTSRKFKSPLSKLDSLSEATEIAQLARLTNLDWSQEPKDEAEARIRKIYLEKQSFIALMYVYDSLRRYDSEGELLEEFEPAKDLAEEYERKSQQNHADITETHSREMKEAYDACSNTPEPASSSGHSLPQDATVVPIPFRRPGEAKRRVNHKALRTLCRFWLEQMSGADDFVSDDDATTFAWDLVTDRNTKEPLHNGRFCIGFNFALAAAAAVLNDPHGDPTSTIRRAAAPLKAELREMEK